MPKDFSKSMWLIALFDLPVLTTEDKQHYRLFRKHLLKDGYTMLQYSVYARYCSHQDEADVHIRRLERNLPPEGEVRLLFLTDTQYGKSRVFVGKSKRFSEKPPSQLVFF